MEIITDFRSTVHHIAGVVILLTLAVFPLSRDQAVANQTVRSPVWAGSFYPADREALERFIDQLVETSGSLADRLAPLQTLQAVILPHAGYVYSGSTAARALPLLKTKRYRTVIVLGPDHRIGFHGNAVSAVSAYDTPLGRVALSPKADLLRDSSPLFRPVAASDAAEHSVEVLLPLLQRSMGAFELIPVVMGPGDPMPNADAIDSLLDPETLLVVSSDLSHFLSYEEAVRKDARTIRAILELDSRYLIGSDNAACGIMPLLTLMEIARRHAWQAVQLAYANSGDTTGDRRRVVGYCAIAFFGDSAMKQERNQLSEDQGRYLTALARRTIAERLGRGHERGADPTDDRTDPALQSRCGTFVTLKIDNRLRGCIGSLDNTTPIVDGVRRNAVQAAFHDPRFSPLTSAEFDQVDIEISVLTQPQPLAYSDADDLLSKLRVNVDGVIIRRGPASATFLPQVWEQLPQPEDFLSHLCLKAGLAASAWRRGDLDVETYQVQYFEEQR